jgi:hypothetical protein
MAKTQAQQWQEDVFRAAGIDSRVCVVCGNARYFYWDAMGKFFTCDCIKSSTKRGQLILDAVQQASAFLELEIRDSAGILVASFFESRQKGVVWNFEQFLPTMDREAVFPPLPQGINIAYPTWWPSEKLATFDAERTKQLPILIDEAKAKAKSLGAVIGRAPQHTTSYCESCGESYCPAADIGDGECVNLDDHPEEILQHWLSVIARQEKLAQDRLELAAIAARDQQQVEAALVKQGYFKGRLGKAKQPDWAMLMSSASAGNKNNPEVFLIAAKLTLEQLQKLVPAFGDLSSIVVENGQVKILTQHPGVWKGSGGTVIKRLSAALGQNIQVVEQHANKTELVSLPISVAPIPTVIKKPLDLLIEQMESGQPLTCSCGGELQIVDKEVNVPGKPKHDRKLVCQTCHKAVDFPKRYLNGISIKHQYSTSDRGSFTFDAEGVTTGSRLMKSPATTDELALLEKVLRLLQLQDESPFKSALAVAKSKL